MFPLFKSPLYISPPSLKVERTNVPLFSARITLRPFFTTPNIFVSFKSENLNDVKNRWSQLKLSSRTAELNKQWWHCWEWQSIGLAMCSQCLLKTWAICWLARPVKREVSDERKGGSDPPNNLSVSLTINSMILVEGYLYVKEFYCLMCPPLSFDHCSIEINNTNKPSLCTCLFIGNN